MSYQGMAGLAQDSDFQARVKAAATIECQSRLDDPNRADWSNLAYDTLRNADHTMDSFIRFVAQTPSIADTAGDPPDQSLISDGDLAAAVDNCYPVVSSLWYNPDGTPWSGAMHPPVEPEPPEPPVVEPVVTSVDPTSGKAGNTVTITGTSLTGTSLVQIDMDCLDLVVVDDTQVTSTVASGVSKGSHPVLVTVDGMVIEGPQFQVI
jgi:hypothetical protein